MKIESFSTSNRSAEYHSSSVADVNKIEGATIKEQQDKQLSVQNNKENKKELTKEEAEHVVNGMNEFLKPKFTSLKFKLHEDLERYYVEVVDQDTQKVVREIPSKELLDMYAKMTEFLGLFIDKKL